MVCVSVEIREGYFTRRVWISAPSIERALEIAGEGKPRRGVRLLFPIDAEAFFVPDGSDEREAACDGACGHLWRGRRSDPSPERDERRGPGASRSSAKERRRREVSLDTWVPSAAAGSSPRRKNWTWEAGQGPGTRAPTRLIAASTASGYASPVQRRAASRKTTRAGTVP